LLRGRPGNVDSAIIVNSDLVLARGGASGASYSIVDAGGRFGDAYWLQEHELDGTTLVYGPVLVDQPAAAPAAGLNTPNDAVALAPAVVLAPEMPAQPTALALPTQAPAVGAPPVAVFAPEAAPAPVAPAVPAFEAVPAPVAPAATQAPVAPAAPAATAEVAAPVDASRNDAPVRIAASATPVHTAAEVAAVQAPPVRHETNLEQPAASNALRGMSLLALLGALMLGTAAAGAIGAVFVIRGRRSGR
jgi:hypothetical protein